MTIFLFTTRTRKHGRSRNWETRRQAGTEIWRSRVPLSTVASILLVSDLDADDLSDIQLTGKLYIDNDSGLTIQEGMHVVSTRDGSNIMRNDVEVDRILYGDDAYHHNWMHSPSLPLPSFRLEIDGEPHILDTNRRERNPGGAC